MIENEAMSIPREVLVNCILGQSSIIFHFLKGKGKLNEIIERDFALFHETANEMICTMGMDFSFQALYAELSGNSWRPIFVQAFELLNKDNPENFNPVAEVANSLAETAFFKQACEEVERIRRGDLSELQ